MKSRFAMYSTLGALMAFAVGAAEAADNTPTAPADTSEQGPRLEEITVTATRREERVEKVPISIDALSQNALREGAVKTISDIATVSPGFQYAEPQNIPSTIQTLSIRGINSSTGQSPVGVYYGDTPLQIKLSGPTNFGSPMPVAFDSNRVEVARGPQGTLFGAGAEAGAVVLVPNSPDMAKFSGYAHAEEGVIDHGGVSYEVQGATGGPIVPDEIGFRLAVYDRHDGGYVDRINPVSLQIVDRNSNTKDSLALRGSLAFKVSDAVKVTPAILHRPSRARHARPELESSGRLYRLRSDDPVRSAESCQFGSPVRVGQPPGDSLSNLTVTAQLHGLRPEPLGRDRGAAPCLESAWRLCHLGRRIVLRPSHPDRHRVST